MSSYGDSEFISLAIQCCLLWPLIIFAVIYLYRKADDSATGSGGGGHRDFLSSKKAGGGGKAAPVVMGYLKADDLDKFTTYEQICTVTPEQIAAMPKDFKMIFDRKKADLRLEEKQKELR